MQKVLIVGAVAIVIAWFGVRQLNQFEIDRDVAAVNSTVTHTIVTLPALNTAVPALEQVAAIDSAQTAHP